MTMTVARTQPIGYGIIGVGIWGQLHARVLAADERVNLLAVCDLDQARARQVAQRHGIPRVYGSHEDLLRDPSIAAVSVTTPDFAHAAPALAAVRSGRHLLIEKPFTTTVEEAAAIILAARESGAKLMVDFHTRWSPAFYHAYQSVQTGELGELKLATFRLSDTTYVPTRYIPWAARSSVLWFLGPHSIDTVRWLFGDEVRDVYAVRRDGVLSGLGIDTPDFYLLILQFERGGVAYLEHSWILSAQAPNLIDVKCQLQGSRGTAYIDNSHNRAFEKYTELTPRGYPDLSYADTAVLPVVQDRQVGYAAESIRHFVDCLWHDRQPLVGGLDGLRATEVILAAEESARINAPVKVIRHGI
jgi:predicted dehydrogenase